jgi:nitrite reductase (NO-forming)
MKKTVLNLMKLTLAGSLVVLYSCGGTTETKEAVEETTNDEVKTEEATATEEVVETATETATLDLTKGKAVYDAKCKVCHQENGEGTPGAFPPLAKSDYLLGNVSEALNGIINGQTAPLTVNGTEYTTAMPANVLTDEEATDVMNYILNSWGNEGGTVTVVDGKLAE